VLTFKTKTWSFLEAKLPTPRAAVGPHRSLAAGPKPDHFKAYLRLGSLNLKDSLHLMTE